MCSWSDHIFLKCESHMSHTPSILLIGNSYPATAMESSTDGSLPRRRRASSRPKTADCRARRCCSCRRDGDGEGQQGRRAHGRHAGLTAATQGSRPPRWARRPAAESCQSLPARAHIKNRERHSLKTWMDLLWVV